MAETKHNLMITLGAALSSGFNSAFSKGTTKIQQIGSEIKNVESQSLKTTKSVFQFQNRYESLLTSMNRQQKIMEKRDFYRSQILRVSL